MEWEPDDERIAAVRENDSSIKGEMSRITHAALVIKGARKGSPGLWKKASYFEKFCLYTGITVGYSSATLSKLRDFKYNSYEASLQVESSSEAIRRNAVRIAASLGGISNQNMEPADAEYFTAIAAAYGKWLADFEAWLKGFQAESCETDADALYDMKRNIPTNTQEFKDFVTRGNVALKLQKKRAVDEARAVRRQAELANEPKNREFNEALNKIALQAALGEVR